MAVMTYREALNLALREEMRRDPRVFVIGEEVGLYDGAYKVTQGLLKEFGEQRIVDTPIAESGFTGIGVGAAMLGLRPVVEMMTFNFSILALDQIVNSAAKMLYMSGGQYNIPLVVRGPGGPAAQLAAQHSQSMETYFYHVPGLKVVRPTTPADAKGLLKSAIRDDNPVIFIEAETLYAVKGEVPDDPDFTIPLGQTEKWYTFTTLGDGKADSAIRLSSENPARDTTTTLLRGQDLFNTRTFTISGVAGINDESAFGTPAQLTVTCTSCHNTPNAGNHSVALPLNIGLTDASRRTSDMPLYTLVNKTTGATVQTTDPGRALVTGKWKDIGKFKGPILRGLAARAPYFHNGFAATLDDVISFYVGRFGVTLSAAERTDLLHFLQSL